MVTLQSAFSSAVTNIRGLLASIFLRRWNTDFAPAIVTLAPKKKPDLKDDYSFQFRGSILDQLDSYFEILARMKKGDQKSFALYSQIGAHILPEYRWIGHNHDASLSPWWKANRPAFGAVAWGVSPEMFKIESAKDNIHPRFIYFRKYANHKAPPFVQRVARGWSIYVVTVYWDQQIKGRPRISAPAEYPVAIDPDGGVHLLRNKIKKEIKIKSKRGPTRSFILSQDAWEYGDDFFKNWAREHNSDVRRFLTAIFIDAAHDYEYAQFPMVRIAVNRGDIIAVFGIDPRRAAYFFKDRDVNINKVGSRRKIFHIVKAHERHLSSGDVSNVRLHFRGERDFTWNGYGVHVTVPGRHHNMIAELRAGLLDYDENEIPRSGDIEIEEAAKLFRDHLSQ